MGKRAEGGEFEKKGNGRRLEERAREDDG